MDQVVLEVLEMNPMRMIKVTFPLNNHLIYIVFQQFVMYLQILYYVELIFFVL